MPEDEAWPDEPKPPRLTLDDEWDELEPDRDGLEREYEDDPDPDPDPDDGRYPLDPNDGEERTSGR